MSLHHRIWELVTMICQTSGHNLPKVIGPSKSVPPAQDTVVADETKLRGPLTEVDGLKGIDHREAEISRLTWAVLDGNATVLERNRLAKLVSEQHEQRHA